MPNPWRLLAGAALALTAAAAAGPVGSEAQLPPPARPQFVAFYIPWDKPALASLKAHVNDIDVFAPMWASIVSPAGKLVWESDEEAHAVLAAATRRPKVMPLISNAHDDVWDAAAAEGVITNDAATRALAAGLIARARTDRFSGVVMDFENLTPKATAGYGAFLSRMRARLNPAGLQVWTTTTITSEDGYGDLSRDADAVVLMAYDQCWAGSYPGPIAADAWLRASLQAKLAGKDAGRYVVALASYGYDWPKGGRATVVSVDRAQKLAASQGAASADPPGSNAHFDYTGANGTPHQVWYVSGADFARQRAIAEQRGVAGVALWRMGLEDSGLWTTQAPIPPPDAAGGPAADCEPLPGR